MATLIILFCAFILLPLTIFSIGKSAQAILLFINREKYRNNEIEAYMLISLIFLFPCIIFLPLFFDFNDAKANVLYEKAFGYCSTQISIDLKKLNTVEQHNFIEQLTPLLNNYQREISKRVSGNKGYSYSVLTASIPVYYTIENNQLIIQLAGKIEHPLTYEWLRYIDDDIQVNQTARFSPWLSSKKWNALPISINSRNLVRECD